MTSHIALLAPRTALLALFAVLALSVTACGGGDKTDRRGNIDVLLEAAIEDAQAQGASENQLELLVHAQEAGLLSYVDAKDASQAAVDCMVRAGVDAQYVERDDGAGVKIPTYVASLAGGNQDAIGDIIDACSLQEEAWVSKVYQLQPSTQNARDEQLERALPRVRQCLSDHAVVVEDDAKLDEVVQASLQLTQDTSTDGGTPGVDCLLESGVLNY